MPANGSQYLIDDGIIVWFDGPEWDEVALEAFQEAQNEVADTARGLAPWEDRTGDARAGLTALAVNDHGDVVLTLFHTVEYGLWLEVIQNGRFASIMPTLEREAPGIIDRTIRKINGAREGVNY